MLGMEDLDGVFVISESGMQGRLGSKFDLLVNTGATQYEMVEAMSSLCLSFGFGLHTAHVRYIRPAT